MSHRIFVGGHGSSLQVPDPLEPHTVDKPRDLCLHLPREELEYLGLPARSLHVHALVYVLAQLEAHHVGQVMARHVGVEATHQVTKLLDARREVGRDATKGTNEV